MSDLRRELLRPAEVAEVLRISEFTLRTWRARGRGPSFVRLSGEGSGGSIRYDARELERWISSREEEATR